jgi:arylsulfatase
VPAPPGQNLVPVFTHDHSVQHDALWWLHEGNRALRVGDWKIVAAGQDAPWELYDLSHDRGEAVNLAVHLPDTVRQLATLWQQHTEAFRQLILANPSPAHKQAAQKAK